MDEPGERSGSSTSRQLPGRTWSIHGKVLGQIYCVVVLFVVLSQSLPTPDRDFDGFGARDGRDWSWIVEQLPETLAFCAIGTLAVYGVLQTVDRLRGR